MCTIHKAVTLWPSKKMTRDCVTTLLNWWWPCVHNKICRDCMTTFVEYGEIHFKAFKLKFVYWFHWCIYCLTEYGKPHPYHTYMCHIWAHNPGCSSKYGVTQHWVRTYTPLKCCVCRLSSCLCLDDAATQKPVATILFCSYKLQIPFCGGCELAD